MLPLELSIRTSLAPLSSELWLVKTSLQKIELRRIGLCPWWFITNTFQWSCADIWDCDTWLGCQSCKIWITICLLLLLSLPPSAPPTCPTCLLLRRRQTGWTLMADLHPPSTQRRANTFSGSQSWESFSLAIALLQNKFWFNMQIECIFINWIA